MLSPFGNIDEFISTYSVSKTVVLQKRGSWSSVGRGTKPTQKDTDLRLLAGAEQSSTAPMQGEQQHY